MELIEFRLPNVAFRRQIPKSDCLGHLDRFDLPGTSEILPVCQMFSRSLKSPYLSLARFPRWLAAVISLEVLSLGPGRTRVRCEVESARRTPEPTALTTMALHLYSGHLNNLFRFLITEARSGSPREDANAAEALALLDCRFYHMLRTYDTHCRE